MDDLDSTLLQTNDPPLPSDVTTINQFLENSSSRLLLLDEEILTLQGKIEKLRIELAPLIADQTAIQEQFRLYSNVLSAFRRIPPEIWQEIFRFTIPAQRQMGTLSTDRLPWVLGQVCSLWRSIALCLPEIWGTIKDVEFPDRGDDESETRYPLPLLKRLLYRSADNPLYISLDVPFGLDHLPPSPAFYQTLADSSHRWNTMRYESLGIPPEMNGIQGQMPLLEVLSLSHMSFISTVFSHAPSLRTLIFTKGPSRESVFPWAPTTPAENAFPWPQIMHFRNLSSTADDHNDILHWITNVVECTLEVDHYLPSSVSLLQPLPDVRLTSLRKLTLRSVCIPPWLVAPSLRELSIDSDHINHIDGLLLRSGCDLQKLTIHVFDNIPHCESFQCTTVAALQLDIFDADTLNDMCALLTFSGQDAAEAHRFPSLETLTLSFDRSRSALLRNFDDAALRRMIESRWARVGCARLADIRFVGETVVSPATRERLHRMEARLRASLGSLMGAFSVSVCGPN
ncbi:hypothetical protein DFH09DRAFT_1143551 [Mycena vulgaris]|nr:hypothetical protein DFH09DRAFT_1143551 [Mycena vulgaris]